MELIDPVSRVVVVVLDGLRADAIDRFELPTLMRLRGTAAWTAHGVTIDPSVTWAAMTSLMTGVPPELHGVVCDSVHLPRPRTKLDPLPAVLADAGLPTTAVLASIPRLFRAVAATIGRRLGIGHLRFIGDGAEDILNSARDRLAAQRRGLIFLHWPDADRAGHDHGWMSPAYEKAATTLDRALGCLIDLVDLNRDEDTLIIALADHGGGGVDPKDHTSEHPYDRTIPLFFTGAGVIPGELGGRVSLLDVPATILWALGIGRPSSYTGLPISRLFGTRRPDASAVA
ncbi:MAG TPA: alkaline phosphatase family protein [Gemmatimonadaceae bacterium]|jgi:hypothetical protein